MRTKIFTPPVKSVLTFMLLFIALLLPQVGWAQTTSQPQKGDGSNDNPFLITTAEELKWYADYVNGESGDGVVHNTACAKLMNDIDLSSVCGEGKGSWVPIAKKGVYNYEQNPRFEGTFEGNGFTIENLYINQEREGYLALFGYIYPSTKRVSIQNLKLKNVYVYGSNNVASLCVRNSTNSTIKNIEIISGEIAAKDEDASGIMDSGNLNNCINRANITCGTYGAAGICREAHGAITRCSNFGKLTSQRGKVGGISTSSTSITTLSNCINYGDIVVKENINDKYYSTSGVLARPWYVGMKNCANFGNIYINSASEYVGVIVGSGVLNKADGIWTNAGILYVNNVAQTNVSVFQDGITWDNDKVNNSATCITPTTDQLASGYLTYLLQQNCTEPTWYQEIGKDDYPVLTATCFNIVSKNANGDYVNIPNHEPNADGICTQCGNYVSAPPTQGDGTAASPYQIEKPCHLSWLRDQVNAGTKDICATLTNDIDLTNYCYKASNGKSELSWEPIGKDDANLWRGTFDGNGHIISNLYVHNSQSNSGLFGCVANSTISNVIVEGEVNGQSSTGGLIGYSKGSNITHCENRVIVKGARFVGGFCGVFETDGNTVSNCVNKGSVTSTDRSAGGIIGSLSSGNVQDCANYANIVGTYNVGGIIGWASSGTVKNALSSGNVKATDNTNRIGVVIGALANSVKASGVLAYYDGAKRISNNAELTLEAIGSGTPGGTYSKQSYSTEALASGKATYALNGSTSTSSVSWYQKIGTDAYPLLTSKGGDIVYHGTECNKTTDVYTNDNSIFGEDGAIPHNMVETAETNGLYCELCTKCHAEKEEGIHYIKDFCGISNNNLKLSLQSDNTYKAVDSKVTITDKDAYNSPVDFTADELDYTREYLGNDMWQAVYVPLDMDATDWTNNGITAAYINNFHEYELEDGSYETVLEVKKATSGSLSAHMPYVIRSAEDGSKTITIRNAQLHKATSQTIDCQSVTRKYEFTGIYTPQSGFNADGSSSLVYVLNKQGTMATISNTATLGAQRWYLTITDRHASSAPQAAMARDIRIKMIGEGTATGINDLRVITSQGSHATQGGIYDLQGRKMNVAPAHGIYIKNGKKYVK